MIALLNTYESGGGAANACLRLFNALTAASEDVRMIVRDHSVTPGLISTVSSVDGFLRALLDGIPLHVYPERELHNFSPSWVPGAGIKKALALLPDVVHLHWVVQGFVHINALRSLNIPVVWTLHDSWAFTGGCHLPGDCRRFMDCCGQCPVLGSDSENDWSRKIWQKKMDSWKNVPLTIVCPSRWLAHQAQSSSLFANRRILVIPNGLDTNLYTPGDKSVARRHLGLPEKSAIILYGAIHALSDKNKGFDLLRAALELVNPDLLSGAVLVVFGDDAAIDMNDSGMTVKGFGAVSDEEQLVLLYRAADLFVAPSRHETLGYTIMESMSCGTPAVAFSVGGIPDLITHGETGYLAAPYDVAEMAHGIEQMLANRDTRQSLAERGREWIVTHMSLPVVAERYRMLYQELKQRAV